MVLKTTPGFGCSFISVRRKKLGKKSIFKIWAFQIFEAENVPVDIFYVVQKRRSSDSDTLKLRNDQSGSFFSFPCSTWLNVMCFSFSVPPAVCFLPVPQRKQQTKCHSWENDKSETHFPPGRVYTGKKQPEFDAVQEILWNLNPVNSGAQPESGLEIMGCRPEDQCFLKTNQDRSWSIKPILRWNLEKEAKNQEAKSRTVN